MSCYGTDAAHAAPNPPSFPRKRESMPSQFLTLSMDSRLRGNDGLLGTTVFIHCLDQLTAQRTTFRGPFTVTTSFMVVKVGVAVWLDDEYVYEVAPDGVVVMVVAASGQTEALAASDMLTEVLMFSTAVADALQVPAGPELVTMAV